MKKIIIFTCLLVVIISQNSFSQKNVIKINPLGLIFGTVPVSYERVITPKIALGCEGTFLSLTATSGSDKVKLNGVGIELRPKFNISDSKELPRGWFLSPLVGYSTLNVTNTSTTTNGGVNLINAGGIAGYQWVFGKSKAGFALELSGGVHYVNISTSGNISEVSYNGFLPRIGLGIGVAF